MSGLGEGDGGMGRLTRVCGLAVCLVLVCSSFLTAQDAQSESQLTPVDQAVGDIDLLSRSLRRPEVGLRLDGEQTSLFMLTPAPDDLRGQALRPGGPQTTYYRVAPGLRARVNRIDYLVRVGRKEYGLNIQPRVDGEFLELIPADAVFELVPMPLLFSQAEQPPQDALPEPRRDAQPWAEVNGRPAENEGLIRGWYTGEAARTIIKRASGGQSPVVDPAQTETPQGRRVGGVRIDTRIDARIDGRVDGRVDGQINAQVDQPLPEEPQRDSP